jgi:hypothetical protein
VLCFAESVGKRGLVDLEEILARDNAHIRSKEAEVLAMLTEFAGPARRELEGAQRDLGRYVPRELLTVFIDPGKHQVARQTIKACTGLLFDVYAAAASKYVIDAEPFISLLPSIAERVRLRLGTIDKDEAEVRSLKWQSVAWGREKPRQSRGFLKWLLSFLGEPTQKEGSGPLHAKGQALTGGADGSPRPTEANSGGLVAAGGTQPSEQPSEPATVGNGADQASIDVGERDKTRPPESVAAFRNRASWLDARLLERGWSTSVPSQWGGPDRKTIEKILRGEPVGNPVLQKLAVALSKQVHQVDVLDIPKN